MGATYPYSNGRGTMADEARKAYRREVCARYRAKMTDEAKERRRLLKARQYYLRKGVTPHEYTALGKWCVANGHSIGAVMSGEVPI